MSKIENFERAFSGNSAGCRRTCDCGLVFFHNDETGYDWEPGEFEQLSHLNSKAISLDYCPSEIRFEGKEYVNACECWLPRAEKIMVFIDGHARQIAEYLTLEKKRKQAIANASPTVE